MEMEFAAIAGVVVVAAFLAVLLRQKSPEQSMAVGLLTGVGVMALLLTKAVPSLNAVKELMASSALPAEYGQILFKALGICLLTQLAADACRDAGELSLIHISRPILWRLNSAWGFHSFLLLIHYPGTADQRPVLVWPGRRGICGEGGYVALLSLSSARLSVPRPKLICSASFTRAMECSSSRPICSFSRRLSMVRICSNRTMESLAKPLPVEFS